MALADRMTGETLVIRADASAGIGAGHVMRCLALAQAWQDAGGRVIFALASGADQVGNRLRTENMDVAEISATPGTADDATQTSELCRKLRSPWLAVDGFHFSAEYRQGVRNAVSRLLLFDDHGEFAPYRCDVVLNTNPYASEELYPQPAAPARYLLGPAYGLLRREFLKRRPQRSEVPSVARSVLVTFGGSDPNNVTLQVIQALALLGDLGLETTVVVGAANPHRSTLETAAQRASNLRLLYNPENLPDLMPAMDLAISAGGGTCYELAFLGVPMFLITMAQNHERTVEAWGQRGAAVNAGWFRELNSERLAARLREVIGNQELRRTLARNAAGMVDGLGASRVVKAMLQQPRSERSDR
ncbi:MAG TPA: UDP-2,4-diacetamido-2,4,6-trideoxy-beta-L-altropyranose hydrolase [Candidatus Dormibacteraeota bacterium]|nr:UDP-2,4-diacetamido-2,4,6-trideoxy-beta-L-altropyranose hydrolase [Candidatus Dormibacteraeota bacterium]